MDGDESQQLPLARIFSIVMPMIVAVATSIGTRRVLSRETIYTLKLVRRGRAIPKARRANMFLVRSAREVMDVDIQVLPVTASFDDYLRRPEHAGRLRHVVAGVITKEHVADSVADSVKAYPQ